MTKLEVIDSALKIGLGSLITAVSGYIILLLTQKHEIAKEEKTTAYKLNEHKKWLYVELLTQSQILVQTYYDNASNGKGEDYLNYLRIYNEVQIVTNNEIRHAAFELLTAVQQFIVIRKEGQERNLLLEMRKRIDKAIAFFQCVANKDLHGVDSL
ncbi:peptidase M14 [Klebsiella quasipneumoniae]|nr:peptidase M14 [Klebsiella quasipneumoniae]